MAPEIAEVLAYFNPGALRLEPGAPLKAITAAERRLKVALPPSMRSFLAERNGLAHFEYRLFGVPPCDRRHDLVGESFTCREVWRPDDMVAVGRDAGMDRYVLLPGEVDEQGECPVAMYEHATGERLGIVASSYARFAWFVLDALRRSCRPDGEYREERIDNPWPFRDPEWVLRHDPGLRRWWMGEKPTRT